MRVFFAAGGTAGHINPAIAMAQILQAAEPNSEFLFAASPGGMERNLVEKAGFSCIPLRIYGLRRSLSPKNLRAIWCAVTGVMRAGELIDNFAPDIVIGTGGYVSYPVLRAAQKAGIPTVLHESNAVPGLSAKMLARRTDAVFLNFASAAARFPRGTNCLQTGMPLRTGFLTMTREAARQNLHIPVNCPLIVSFGGSLGSDALNRLIVGTIRNTCIAIPGTRWIHGCGKGKAEQCHLYAKDAGGLPAGCEIRPYLTNMAELMAAADLVICRAGAATAVELSAIGRVSVMVPWRGAVGDHQFSNATAIAEAGGCVCVEEEKMTPTAMADIVISLLRDKGKREEVERAVSKLGIVCSPERFLSALRSLL